MRHARSSRCPARSARPPMRARMPAGCRALMTTLRAAGFRRSRCTPTPFGSPATLCPRTQAGDRPITVDETPERAGSVAPSPRGRRIPTAVRLIGRLAAKRVRAQGPGRSVAHGRALSSSRLLQPEPMPLAVGCLEGSQASDSGKAQLRHQRGGGASTTTLAGERGPALGRARTARARARLETEVGSPSDEDASSLATGLRLTRPALR